MRLLITVLSLSLLAGCAITKEDCASLNWQQQGLEDGFKGLVARSGYWQAQCQQHGYKVDNSAYSKGWAEGNRQYCTPEQGYRNGSLGNHYQGVCQGSAKDDFMRSYERGWKVYERNQYRESLYDRQRDIRWRISEIDDRLGDDKLSHKTRNHLKWERDQLIQESMHIDSLLLRMM